MLVYLQLSLLWNSKRRTRPRAERSHLKGKERIRVWHCSGGRADPGRAPGRAPGQPKHILANQRIQLSESETLARSPAFRPFPFCKPHARGGASCGAERLDRLCVHSGPSFSRNPMVIDQTARTAHLRLCVMMADRTGRPLRVMWLLRAEPLPYSRSTRIGRLSSKISRAISRVLPS